jgi:sugar lactone lactonase YvrE
LLVAESAGQRVSAFDITDEGTLTNRRTWCSFGEPATATNLRAVFGQVQTWPDGIALDAEDGLWVADPVGRALIRVHGDEVTDRIATGELACQACTLGGPDGRTLFVCAAPYAPDPDAYRSRRAAQLLRYPVQVPAA